MLLQELTGVKQLNNKMAGEILKDLKSRYGIKVANGAFGVVLDHPDWDHVVKFFAEDDCYLKFVRMAMEHPGPSFPKFKRKPLKMTTFFKSATQGASTKEFFAVKIEKLLPMKRGTPWFTVHEQITNSLFMVRQWREWKRLPQAEQFEKIKDHFNDIIDPDKILNFIEAVDTCQEYLSNTGGCYFDLHDENVMIRSDGNLVISDPFATNDHNPLYIDHIISNFDLRRLVDQDVRKTVDTMANAFNG